jgi:hypothetical protein
MKPKPIAVIVLSALLTGLLLGGCDASELNLPGAWPSEDDTTPTPTETTPVIPTEGAFTWNDVPLYPGTRIVPDASWQVLLPTVNDVYARIEWQYFRVDTDVPTIATYYHTQLIGLGWAEMTYMDMNISASGTYLRNYETDMAVFWVGANDKDETVLALMRASK